MLDLGTTLIVGVLFLLTVCGPVVCLLAAMRSRPQLEAGRVAFKTK